MARWWPVLGNTVSFALASSGNMSGRGCPSLKRSSRDYSTTGDYTSCNHIWLVVWNLFIFSIQLGISSFQLTNSIMFQRGRAQPPTRYVWIVIVECLDNSLYILLNWYIIQTLYNTHFYLLHIIYVACESPGMDPWPDLGPEIHGGAPLFSASKILGRLPWGIQDGRKSPIKWAGVPYRMGLWLIVSQWIIPENSLRLAPVRHCRCKKNHVWWHRR